MSWSVRLLISSGVILILFSGVVLFLMAFFQIPEPSTLITAFFGAFMVTEGVNGFLSGIKHKAEAKLDELAFKATEQCDRTLGEMAETYNNAEG
jgi:uncharacterized membrane protein HdeD (DUF308 family)